MVMGKKEILNEQRIIRMESYIQTAITDIKDVADSALLLGFDNLSDILQEIADTLEMADK